MNIAISMGDPRGIGPEVILKALDSELDADVNFSVHGSMKVFRSCAERLGMTLPECGVRWHDIGDGTHDAGRLQWQALEAALDEVQEGRAAALCTAPVTKASLVAAGFPFVGHTEYLAHKAGSSRAFMMLAGPELRVVPLTNHVAVKRVSELLTPDLVSDGLCATAEALCTRFALPRARVALTGLNPHAGESGVVGTEEADILVPGLERARQRLQADRLPVELAGPLPADGLFARQPIPFDAVVCCFHDQALIPLKMRHPNDAVNITLGVPFVRTSPAHGTALDICGKGIADPGSMIVALRVAAQLARGRAAADRFDTHPQAVLNI